MQLKRTATHTVNPIVAAVAIAVVLGIVQYIWWMKLVHKETAQGFGQQRGGGAGPGALVVVGQKAVVVDTLAGTIEPGSDDGPAYAARFDGPSGLAVDPSGTVFVADTRNNRIRAVSPKGKTTTVAGSAAGFRDGTAQEALFDSPSGVAAGPDGSLYVADTNNNRIRLIRNGQVSTLAGAAAGKADGPGDKARFQQPTALSIDESGPHGPALLIADSGNRRVCRIALTAPNPTVTTAASFDSVCTGVASSHGKLAAVCPDAGRITFGTTTLSGTPVQLGADADGHKLGDIRSKSPVAICMVGDRLFVADTGHGAVLQVGSTDAQVLAGFCSTSGSVRGIRDGTGDRAFFGSITGMASDGKQHIYVADCSNNAIRRLTLPATSNSAAGLMAGVHLAQTGGVH